MKTRMSKDGLVPDGSRREQFAAHMKSETEKCARVIKASGTTAD